jgi:hypothetical protein
MSFFSLLEIDVIFEISLRYVTDHYSIVILKTTSDLGGLNIITQSQLLNNIFRGQN